VRPSGFWPLIVAALLLTAAASACLTFAYVNRGYESSETWDRLTDVAPSMPPSLPRFQEALRGSARSLEEPLPWLVVGVVLAVMALVSLTVAVRRR